jgi:hypothetical protein
MARMQPPAACEVRHCRWKRDAPEQRRVAGFRVGPRKHMRTRASIAIEVSFFLVHNSTTTAGAPPRSPLPRRIHPPVDRERTSAAARPPSGALPHDVAHRHFAETRIRAVLNSGSLIEGRGVLLGGICSFEMHSGLQLLPWPPTCCSSRSYPLRAHHCGVEGQEPPRAQEALRHRCPLRTALSGSSICSSPWISASR